MRSMGLGKIMLAKIAEARVPIMPVSNTPIKSKSPSEDCKKIATMNLFLLRRLRSAKDCFCNLQNSTVSPYLNAFDLIIGGNTLDRIHETLENKQGPLFPHGYRLIPR